MVFYHRYDMKFLYKEDNYVTQLVFSYFNKMFAIPLIQSAEPENLGFYFFLLLWYLFICDHFKESHPRVF